jgi:hypothetical protein
VLPCWQQCPAAWPHPPLLTGLQEWQRCVPCHTIALPFLYDKCCKTWRGLRG